MFSLYDQQILDEHGYTNSLTIIGTYMKHEQNYDAFIKEIFPEQQPLHVNQEELENKLKIKIHYDIPRTNNPKSFGYFLSVEGDHDAFMDEYDDQELFEAYSKLIAF